MGFLEKLKEIKPSFLVVNEVLVRDVFGEPDRVLEVLRKKLVDEGARVNYDREKNTLVVKHGKLKAYNPSDYKKHVVVKAEKEGLRTVLKVFIDVRKYVYTWLLLDFIVLAIGSYIAYSGFAATLYLFDIFKGLPLTPLAKYIIDVVGTSFLLDMILFMSGLMILFAILDLYPTLNALKFSHNWMWDLIDSVKEEIEGKIKPGKEGKQETSTS